MSQLGSSSGSATSTARTSRLRKDVVGGARPSQVTIVTIDGTDRDDCEVTGPESDPALD